MNEIYIDKLLGYKPLQLWLSGKSRIQINENTIIEGTERLWLYCQKTISQSIVMSFDFSVPPIEKKRKIHWHVISTPDFSNFDVVTAIDLDHLGEIQSVYETTLNQDKGSDGYDEDSEPYLCLQFLNHYTIWIKFTDSSLSGYELTISKIPA
jgi:hypothetical protein